MHTNNGMANYNNQFKQLFVECKQQDKRKVPEHIV